MCVLSSKARAKKHQEDILMYSSLDFLLNFSGHFLVGMGFDVLTAVKNSYYGLHVGPPLWSTGQSFWLQIQRCWVRF
jgi:hypothetical protein